jgi:hypothetical protein
MIKERASERIEFLGAEEEAKNALIDLSVTGAAFVHPIEAKKDSLISVKIKNYTLDAVVVYCSPRASGFRIGMHFKNVPPEVQKSLLKLVEEFSRGVPLTCEIVDKSQKSDKGSDKE